MKKSFIKILKNETVICEKCEIANNPITRFMGLMFRKGLGEGCGLLLEPCNEIHTFNMRFSIDVITLSNENEVLAVFDSVPPWRVKPSVKGGKRVIELNSGIAEKFGINCGDILKLIQIN